jgi:predicted regulator of Ras-like GTPase activity (Roadblock/LC7/MglB family)
MLHSTLDADGLKGAVMAEMRTEGSRAVRLDRAIRDLLTQTTDIEAAAVVSFDGLPMASALPAGMDEDRVAAMSAALLSLGERATVGLGRGELSQVFIEGEHGTVFLVSADNEAVLVAVAAKGAKAGLMLYEVKRVAATVGSILRADEAETAIPDEVSEAFEALAAAGDGTTEWAPLPTTAPYAPLGSHPESNGTSWA